MIKLVILTKNIKNTTAIKFIDELLKSNISVDKIILENPKISLPHKKTFLIILKKIKKRIKNILNIYKKIYNTYSKTCISIKEEALDKYETIFDIEQIVENIIEVNNHNSEYTEKIIEDLKPDVILVLGTRILKERIITI